MSRSNSILDNTKHYGNQIITATHSEHLILRMIRLVREKKLDPSDLCVLYVSRDNNGSSVKRIHVDIEGNFVEPWPDDFFELGFKERFS